MAFSTVVDFVLALQLNRASKPRLRKALLLTSLTVNLGLLGFFKYYNFFIESLVDAVSLFGTPLHVSSLSIVLPVGISFYTFQTLSYTIDVYRGQLTPSRSFIEFAAFVSFFPQLVAGPIERASNLLPQFASDRSFKYDVAVIGLRQVLWGMFKKMVIADNCAQYVDQIFGSYTEQPPVMLVAGAFFFSMQIYGDFSGYSDMAIGISRLFGFDLMRNFAFPYFSRDIAEFWRRWHISLSTWFRDYLYIPLGGSKGGKSMQLRNTMIIFLVSGFWHGANWTFIVWGALNALYFLPLLMSGRNRMNLGTVAEGRWLPTIKEAMNMAITFCLTMAAWVFFRAESVSMALQYLWLTISGVCGSSGHLATAIGNTGIPLIILLALVTLFLLIEWIGRTDQFAIERVLERLRPPMRWTAYVVLTLLIFAFKGDQQEFIYFQF